MTDEGAVSLTLTRLESEHSVVADTSVADNQWHHIYIRYAAHFLCQKLIIILFRYEIFHDEECLINVL